MPKRTNAFQELVGLIERAFASKDDKVTASAMVKVQGLETEREIDILRETATGLYRIKVAIEAMDDARPVTLPDFDSYVAKYRAEGRLLVDKFILVSRNGFTGGVVEKAKLLDVPLLTVDEAKQTDWTAFGPGYSMLKAGVQFLFSTGPYLENIEVVPAPGEGLGRIAATEGRVMCQHGHDHGSGPELAIKALADETRNRRPPPVSVRQPIDFRFPGYYLRFRGHDYPIEKLTAILCCEFKSGPVDAKVLEVATSDGSSKYSLHLSAKVGDKSFDCIMPKGLGSDKIVLKMKDKKADK